MQALSQSVAFAENANINKRMLGSDLIFDIIFLFFIRFKIGEQALAVLEKITTTAEMSG
ncbi:hypothetical protein MACH26_35980 [Planctobacterium marinum]|uniref:Uncharacterized protein n=1 Tax=Planctobacterium marinum TaxID=1631968 RepID=A0AA48HR25_9ALTE|nr:hypothetical protein MACH26_35980 [Planctobacterium marinum]